VEGLTARGQNRCRLSVVRYTRFALLFAFLLPAMLVSARRAAAQLPAPAASAPVPIHLGGYGSLVANASRLGDSTHISESTIALLASGTLAHRFAYFAEIDGVRSSRENYAGRQDDRAFEVARMYAEYTIADAARIRIGRFLTPVGQWNESPAEPVTWTAVRPLSTYRPFAKEATGLLLAGTRELNGHDAGYALYAAAASGGRDTNEVRFTRAFGARVAVELAPRVWLGVSVASVAEARPFQTEDDAGESTGVDRLLRVARRSLDLVDETDGEVRDQHARTLLGADARVQMAGVDVLAEAIALSPAGGLPGQQGAFVQAAIPTGLPSLSLVGRAEWYAPPNGQQVSSGSLGLAYRAPQRLTLKLERQLTDSPSPRVARGWFAGVSLLF
jgi:hypothetical protein